MKKFPFIGAVLIAAILGLLAREQYKDYLFMLIIGLYIGFYYQDKDQI
jgi:hypothetical protein